MDEHITVYDKMYTRVSLIGKAKDPNDQSAWAEFIAYYRKYIYNMVRKMGLQHHDADEVVQMTLVKVWNAMPSFDYKPSRGRFRSWLCRIAGNTAKNFIRSRGPVPVSLSSIDFDTEDTLDCAVRPEVEALAENEWEKYLPELALKNISRTFDKRTIQVFTMFTQGFSAPAIAERLGLAESSVYVYKQRVKVRLTEEIARLSNEL